MQRIVRDTLARIGCTNLDFGIDALNAGVWVSIHDQSPVIADGVRGSSGREQGAGDQGITFGFACNETPGLGPDGNSQVTVEYRDGRPARIAEVVIAQQQEILEKVVRPVCGAYYDAETRRHINAASRFTFSEPRPTNISVDTFGTGRVDEGRIEALDLQRPICAKTAAYGHFGRENPDFTWERADRAAALRTDAGI